PTEVISRASPRHGRCTGGGDMKNRRWLLLTLCIGACAPVDNTDTTEEASSCPSTLPRCQHPPVPINPPPPIAITLDHVEPLALEEGAPVTVFFTAKNVSSTVRNGWVGLTVTPPG